MITFRYRHLSAASGRLRRRITTSVHLDRVIIKIRLGLLTRRWRHILVIHRHITLWIIITRIVHIVPSSWRLRRLCRSRCGLIREIQPDIWTPASNWTFRLIPENNQGPIGCLHILKTRRILRHRKEEHVIMVTLVPQNNNGIRMTMNQRQRLPISPPVDISILKLQVRECQDSNSLKQWPKSGSIRR